jgi:hypothetical protein
MVTVENRNKVSPVAPVRPNTRRPQRQPQQALLEEMAALFMKLEKLDEWPEAVILHCSAWAAIMSAEIPRR